jgi:hypothetical protein
MVIDLNARCTVRVSFNIDATAQKTLTVEGSGGTIVMAVWLGECEGNSRAREDHADDEHHGAELLGVRSC